MPSHGAIRAGRAYVETFVDNSRLVRGLKAASARLEAWGVQVSAVGRTLLTAFGAVAIPVAYATRTFMSFEDQMKAVQAVTGTVGREFDMLTEKAKLLGRTTSYTASEVAAGMLTLARAGFAPQEIDAAIAGMLSLARATGTDLAEASDIAAGTLRAFGLEAREVGRVADVLVATANSSAQTLTDLGESMAYAAPIAAELGMSVEETAKSLGVLANMQIKGSMAGTALRKMMLSLADPAVQKKLQGLGVEIFTDTGDLRSDLGNLMAEIGQAMQGMTSGQRLDLLNQMFGQRAMAAASKLATADFPALVRAIDQAQGAAEKTAATMDSGLGGAFRRMLSAVEGVQIALGEALSGTLDGWSEKLSKVSGVITKAINSNKEFVVALVKVAAVVGAAGAALLVVGGTLWALGTALGAIGSLITGTISVLGTVIGALLSPIGLVAAAVVGLGVAFFKFTDTGQELLGTLAAKFGELKDFAVASWQGIANALAAGDLAAAGDIAWKSLMVVWQQGVAWVNKLWETVKWNFIATWTEAYTMLAKMGVNAWSTIRKAFVETVAGMTKLWHSFMKNIGNLWNNAQKWMGNMLLDALEKVGILSESTADMAREEMNRDLDKQIGDREKNRQKGIDEAEQQRQAEIAKIEGEQDEMLDDLDRQRQQRYEALNEQYGKDVADAQRALDEAREQWQASLNKSEEKAAGADGKEPDYDLKRKEKQLKAVDLDETAAEVSSSRGTFNAMALLGLQSTGPQERTAAATEQTAKNTKKLLDENKRNKLAFA